MITEQGENGEFPEYTTQRRELWSWVSVFLQVDSGR